MQCNAAVFYDIENLIYPFAAKSNTILQLDEIHRRILEIEGVKGISVQKAYADWAMQINRNLRNCVLQVGIEPIQIFNTNLHDKFKNAADVSLIIDAVELLIKRPEIETYIIVSGDGIYAFLAKKLHEYGKRVIGVGFEKNTNIIFQNACDYYVSLEKSDKKLVSVSNKSRSQGKNAEAAPQPVEVVETKEAEPVKVIEKKPQVVKIPRRFPKNKFSEALSASGVGIWRDEKDLNGALLTIRNIVTGMYEKLPGDAGDLEISVFKEYIEFFVPSFKMIQYGHKRFNAFMRFLVTGSPYCVYTAEGTTLKLARRSETENKGAIMEDIQGLEVTLADGTVVKSLFDIPGNTKFTYGIVEPAKPAAKPRQQRGTKQRGRRQAKQTLPVEQNAAAVEAVAAAEEDIAGDGSIRKFVKDSFLKLSAENSLSLGEAKRLMTSEYSLQTFGLKTPILKEIDSKSNLEEKRTVNGKIKYWKELFKYNNRSYLVFKEWSAPLHKDRFCAWLKSVETKAEKKKKIEK